MKAAPSDRGFLVGSRLLAELALPQVAVVEVAAVEAITTPEAVMATATVTAMVAIRQRQHLTHQMCRLLPV